MTSSPARPVRVGARPKQWAPGVQVLAIVGLTVAIALIQVGRLGEGIALAIIGLVAIDVTA